MRREPKISEEAVRKATGKGWSDWLGFLHQEGASELSHKNIVKLLERDVESAWWRQSIAVEYEYAHRMRKVGKTEEVGFEIGAQQMLHVPQAKVWDFLLSPKGLRLWLGDVEGLDLKPRTKYETGDGTTGEMRTVKPGERLRLTWKPKDWDKPSTLQVTVTCPRNTADKTNLTFHQEKLTSTEAREKMRTHWKQVLERIAGALEAPAGANHSS